MSFKSYIQSKPDNILVEFDHLESVTFEDICTLIHLIVTQNKRVLLSDEVKEYLGYEAFSQGTSVELKKVENCEELLVLLYISDGLYLDQSFQVDIFWDANQDGKGTYHPKYKMSNKFLTAAWEYNILEYPCVKKIICNFDIFDGTLDTSDADETFDRYMGEAETAARTV